MPEATRNGRIRNDSFFISDVNRGRKLPNPACSQRGSEETVWFNALRLESTRFAFEEACDRKAGWGDLRSDGQERGRRLWGGRNAPKPGSPQPAFRPQAGVSCGRHGAPSASNHSFLGT